MAMLAFAVLGQDIEGKVLNITILTVFCSFISRSPLKRNVINAIGRDRVGEGKDAFLADRQGNVLIQV